ncbi:hypothetical protein evm_015212 [Chilo suppressalis]|nr:hypothetical protein evm_015212 [Chilo suppressalis]
MSPLARAQAFPEDGIGRLDRDPPRGPSADWRVLTTADAAGPNGLTCLPKHGATRDRFSVTHPMTDHCESCLTSFMYMYIQRSSMAQVVTAFGCNLEVKQLSPWSVVGWVTEALLSLPPLCFGRHVEPLAPAVVGLTGKRSAVCLEHALRLLSTGHSAADGTLVSHVSLHELQDALTAAESMQITLNAGGSKAPRRTTPNTAASKNKSD